MKTIVTMDSNQLGTRIFDFESKEDAKKTFERLTKSTNKQFQKDGIDRMLILSSGGKVESKINWVSKK